MAKKIDYGLGYFAIFPPGFMGHDEPWLFISKDCPPDIRGRLEKDWPIAKKETEERRSKGLWDSSIDYF